MLRLELDNFLLDRQVIPRISVAFLAQLQLERLLRVFRLGASSFTSGVGELLDRSLRVYVYSLLTHAATGTFGVGLPIPTQQFFIFLS